MICFQPEPPPPLEPSRVITGEVCVRLWHDKRAGVLSVTVLEARELPIREDDEQQLPTTFAKVHLLPDRGLVIDFSSSLHKYFGRKVVIH